jgi:hypothetical protein
MDFLKLFAPNICRLLPLGAKHFRYKLLTIPSEIYNTNLSATPLALTSLDYAEGKLSIRPESSE